MTGDVTAKHKARFLVGIDLGTTHTVVAFAPIDHPENVQVLPVYQRTQASEFRALPWLPSYLYARLESEPSDHESDPWWVGEAARQRGAEVPGRLVASAKSWLCHSAVDRLAPLLPWGSASDDDVSISRISPVDASARYLLAVKRAWALVHPDFLLEDQHIVLTVPASFDAAARELTIEATQRVGLSVKLLEEPTAAFYDWMQREGDAAVRQLLRRSTGAASSTPTANSSTFADQPDEHGESQKQSALVALKHAQNSLKKRADGMALLIVDVGGGTTDFSMIKIADSTAGLSIDRVAVGDHLLIGGDNMDLALAMFCEPHLLDPTRRKLEPARFAQLVTQCRIAKETLLSANPPDHVPITILGSGSRLIGGTKSTQLNLGDAHKLLLDGFFPEVPLSARPERARGGLISLGLPYARDTAITRHLAAFIERAGIGAPTAVLLNGGVFLGESLAQRLLSVLSEWANHPVTLLSSPHPELAVARGAVAYAAAMQGHGRRVGGGSAHSYFVGIDSPGEAKKAVCVLPRGTPLAAVQQVPLPLSLLVGQHARFELFSRADSSNAVVGEVVEVNVFDAEGDSFHSLPSVATRIDSRSSKTHVPVLLECCLSEVGTLDLVARELDDQQLPTNSVHRLAFELRSSPSSASQPPASIGPPVSRRPLSVVPSARFDDRPIDERRLEEPFKRLTKVFGKSPEPATEREVKDLVRDLERWLGDRSSWSLEINRSLFDHLANLQKGRRRSPDHERLFWSLAGYCLRPGIGTPQDVARVNLISPLFGENITHKNEQRVWQQWWIAWRRIAAGLDETIQCAIRDIADPILDPTAPKKKQKGPDPSDEMMALCASLERVPAQRRALLGTWLYEKTWTKRDARLWDNLGRIGARVPSYASAHYVIAPKYVEEWVNDLLRDKNWADLPTVPLCIARLAQKTGDRARDIPDRMRNEVIARLEKSNIAPRLINMVRDVVTVDDSSASEFLGESLPVGLRLLPS